MITLQVKNYSKREDLENEIGKLVGKTSEIKRDYEIKGTIEELSRLQLSSQTLVWGIRCIATNEKPKKEQQYQKSQRGEIYKFGININNQ